MDPSVTAQVPVVLSHDGRYSCDPYQLMPADGYTAMFQHMLNHPKKEIQLESDACRSLQFRNGQTFFRDDPFSKPIIYTGFVDERFHYIFGPLVYRSIIFKFDTLPIDHFQTCAAVNYTADKPYTRITEFKYITGQKKDGITSFLKEIPKPYARTQNEIPCCAVNDKQNHILYSRYAWMASQYKNLYLLGRLGEYKYYNMDEIVLKSLTLADRILQNQ